MPSPPLLILFTRYPEPGTTKTRLIPLLGEEGAARLQRRMTELASRQARQLAGRLHLAVRICYSGGSETGMRGWLGGDFAYFPQGEGDIGRRMEQAFGDGFAAGAQRIVLAGCDIPGLTGAILETAFTDLDRFQAVLGPAMDGGYYLIGLRADVPPAMRARLFTGISWSTPSVFTQTIGVLTAAGFGYSVLPALRDIDTPEDFGAAGLYLQP